MEVVGNVRGHEGAFILIWDMGSPPDPSSPATSSHMAQPLNSNRRRFGSQLPWWTEQGHIARGEPTARMTKLPILPRNLLSHFWQLPPDPRGLPNVTVQPPADGAACPSNSNDIGGYKLVPRAFL
jgi:hypothetical protein